MDTTFNKVCRQADDQYLSGKLASKLQLLLQSLLRQAFFYRSQTAQPALTTGSGAEEQEQDPGGLAPHEVSS